LLDEGFAGRPATTSRALADWLRDQIYAGALAPGQRLRQAELAKRFGVSTTPVREALSALQAEGLIVGDPHRGAVVFRPDPRDAQESLEIRQVLETFALERAVPNMDSGVLANLQTLIDQMHEARGYEEWSALNEAFHAALYAPSERPRLLDLVASLRRASSYYIHLAVADQLPNDAADAEHQAILDACVKRDVVAATWALRVHLQSTARVVLEHLDGTH
jgi:DNA-binding GntR family transcriptional regulator